MPVVQTYTLDMVPHSTPVVVPVSQYDVGRQIKFNIVSDGAPFTVSSYSATLSGRFQNGNGFSITGSVSGSTVTFVCTEVTTAYYGPVLAEIRFAKNGEAVGTANFLWKVEEAPDYKTAVTQDDIEIFRQLLTQSQQAAGNAQNYISQAQTHAQTAQTHANTAQTAATTAQTAASNAQTYAQQAQAAAAGVGNRKYIFIGDSYGYGTHMSDRSQNWINRTVEILGLSSSNYYKTAVEGSGFVGQTNVTTFLQQLTALDLSYANKTSITDIVVLGGWNDMSAAQNGTSLKSAMLSFGTHVKSNYPNAKVWLGMVSWIDTYKWFVTDGGTNPTFHLRTVLEMYSTIASSSGWHFINNMQYVLHWCEYFTSDGLHPNADGQQEIARFLSGALQGSDVLVFRSNTRDEDYQSVSPASTTAWVFSYLNNSRARVMLYQEGGFRVTYDNSHKQTIKAAGFGGSGTTVLTVGQFGDAICCRGGHYTELQYSGPCMVLEDNTWVECGGHIRMGPTNGGQSNKLQVALSKTTGTSYRTFTNVTEIWFPQSNIYMEADCMNC